MNSYKWVIENGIEYIVEEYHNGTKMWWCVHGRYDINLHRIKGPAVEYDDGNKAWYLNEEEYTKKEYYKELLRRKIITKKEAFIELL